MARANFSSRYDLMQNQDRNRKLVIENHQEVPRRDG